MTKPKDMNLSKALWQEWESISLKIDGTQILWDCHHLISDRGIIRDNRFPHIKAILTANNFPKCYGEMFIPKERINKKRTCIFDVNNSKNWKNAVFMPFDLSLSKAIMNLNGNNNKDIVQMKLFTNVLEGWSYCLENDEEGLVLVCPNRISYKIKVLFEAKVLISHHEKGSKKGAFVLMNGSKVSGTSEGFVNQFIDMKQKELEVYAEIEYMFKTETGSFFQPRLRRIGTAFELGIGS